MVSKARRLPERDAGDHHQLIPGDVYADMFEIVLGGPLDPDELHKTQSFTSTRDLARSSAIHASNLGRLLVLQFHHDLPWRTSVMGFQTGAPLVDNLNDIESLGDAMIGLNAPISRVRATFSTSGTMLPFPHKTDGAAGGACRSLGKLHRHRLKTFPSLILLRAPSATSPRPIADKIIRRGRHGNQDL